MELSENRANTLADFAYVLSRFKMPGDGLIPDYREWLRSSGAGISRRLFLERVVMPFPLVGRRAPAGGEERGAGADGF